MKKHCKKRFYSFENKLYAHVTAVKNDEIFFKHAPQEIIGTYSIYFTQLKNLFNVDDKLKKLEKEMIAFRRVFKTTLFIVAPFLRRGDSKHI